MKRLVGALVCVTSVLFPLAAHATSGPGCFVVVNVQSWDVLNVRSGPSASNPIVDYLPPGRHGIISQSGPCIPYNKPVPSRWCPVTHYNGDRVTSGWVKRRYVRPGQCP
jgi:uncharacterized protein YraI